ncbi:MAG: EAL domain-containing protein [Firmicutes bacterium]|nr:EAL domain-containing protein [Bacillota bacterium]
MELTEHNLDIVHLWPQWRRGGGIQAVFQPIVSLQSGTVTAYEALSRPYDASGGPVPILALIASAEQHHQLVVLDRLAYTAMMKSVKEMTWPHNTRLFINVVPRSIEDPGPLLDLIKTQRTVPPDHIILEISERESLAEGDAYLSQLLQPFRDIGVKIALDDLGAGYSGLNRLAELKPDFAKIDLSLIRDVDRNSIKLALVESTVRFATKTAAIEIVAEGIETPSELFTLQEIGVDFGQGYLLGRPLPHLTSRSHTGFFNRSLEPPKDHSEHLQALLNTAQRMVQGMARGEGRNTHLVRLAQRMLGADVVTLFKRESDQLVVYETTLSDALFPATRRIPILADTAYSKPLIDRSAFIRQTLADDPSPWSRELALESGIAVPICDNYDCWGVLHVGFYAPHKIRPDMVKLTEGLAHLFVLALGYGNLEQSVQETSDPLGEPLYEAIFTLAETHDVDRLLAKVVQAALSVSQGHEGWIGLLNEENLHCIEPDGQIFDISRTDLFDETTVDGQGPVGKILQTRQPLIIQDIQHEPILFPWLDQMLESGIKAAMGLPLLVGDRLLGIMKVYHSEVNGFTLGRVRRLSALASLATTLIEKSLSLQATQKAQERQRQLTEALYAISSCTTEDGILLIVAHAAQQLTGSELVILLEPDTLEFRHRATAGSLSHASGSLKIPFQAISESPLNIFNQAFHSGSPVVLDIAQKDGECPWAIRHWAERYGLRHTAIIPLNSHGQSLGLLAIFLVASSQTLATLRTEMTSFVHAAASALYDRRLTHLLQEEKAQVDVLIRASQELPLVSTIDDLWQRVGAIITESMGASGGWVIEDLAQLPSCYVFGRAKSYEGLLQQKFQEADPRGYHSVVRTNDQLDPRLRAFKVNASSIFSISLYGHRTSSLLAVHSEDPQYFTAARLHLVEVLLGYVAVSYEVVRLREQETQSLVLDPLTRLANRYAIQRCFHEESERMKQGQSQSMAIVLFDVVGFSRINAEHGYQGGNVVLRDLADALSQHKDDDAKVGRLGSDEFVLLYRNRDQDSLWREIIQLAEQLPYPTSWCLVYTQNPDHEFADLIQLGYQHMTPRGAMIHASS